MLLIFCENTIFFFQTLQLGQKYPKIDYGCLKTKKKRRTFAVNI